MKPTRYDNTNQLKAYNEVKRAREAVGLKPLTFEEWLKEKRFRTASHKVAHKAPKNTWRNA